MRKNKICVSLNDTDLAELNKLCKQFDFSKSQVVSLLLKSPQLLNQIKKGGASYSADKK